MMISSKEALEILQYIANLIPTVHSVLPSKPRQKTINFRVKYEGWGIDGKGSWTAQTFLPFLKMHGLEGYAITDDAGFLTGFFGFTKERLIERAGQVILSLCVEPSHWDFMGKEGEPPVVASLDNPDADIEDQLAKLQTQFALAFKDHFEKKRLMWASDIWSVQSYLHCLIGLFEKGISCKK